MDGHTVIKKKKKQKNEKRKRKQKQKQTIEDDVEKEMENEDEAEENGEDNEEGISNDVEVKKGQSHDDDEEEEGEKEIEEEYPTTETQPDPTIPTSDSRLPFTAFPLSPSTLRALSALSLTNATPIQSACLPPLLAGQDLLGAAPTGSGKTLAFLLPAIELLHRLKFKPANGTGVIVISPTRELALQIFGVARDLLREGGFSQTVGVLMGGANRRAEEEKLCKGVALVVATPGRLWDHLRDTKGFVRRNLKALVIDEADRILEIGFEQQMRDIIAMLPKERQTLLFSATQTTKVTDLARISLRPGPLHIDVAKSWSSSTVPTLSQGYIVCPAEHRFLLLFTFLKKNLKKKVIVFFSSCNSVKYHAELLNYIDVPVLDLHGKQKQQKRTATFFSFLNSSSGTLLCTNVAARGLDIPSVDYIIQYDPPDDPRDYIHRVGRTARAGKGGKSLLFLMESELGFLRYLKEAKVTLNEFGFPKDRIENVQSQLEKLLEKNYHLYRSAVEGFRAYLQAYASYGLKRIFDVNKLDLGQVGKAFGFKVPPRVNLGVPGSGKGEGDSESVLKRKRQKEEEVSDDEEGEGGKREEKRYRGKEKEKRRRTEVHGRKAVEKEKYRKRKVGGNWSR